MHPRLAELLEATEAARTELLSAVSLAGEDRWLTRAASGGWRVADVVGHLHLVEDGTVRLLFRSLRDAVAQGLRREDDVTSLLGSLDGFRVETYAEPRVAPASVVASDVGDRAAILAGLTRSREGLRLWAREADGFALGDIVRPHPALGPLTLYQWVLFLGQHERRHLGQLRRILGPNGA